MMPIVAVQDQEIDPVWFEWESLVNIQPTKNHLAYGKIDILEFIGLICFLKK